MYLPLYLGYHSVVMVIHDASLTILREKLVDLVLALPYVEFLWHSNAREAATSTYRAGNVQTPTVTQPLLPGNT